MPFLGSDSCKTNVTKTCTVYLIILLRSAITLPHIFTQQNTDPSADDYEIYLFSWEENFYADSVELHSLQCFGYRMITGCKENTVHPQITMHVSHWNFDFQSPGDYLVKNLPCRDKACLKILAPIVMRVYLSLYVCMCRNTWIPISTLSIC